MEYLSGLVRLELLYFGELDDQLQLSTLRRLKVSCDTVNTPHAISIELDALRSALGHNNQLHSDSTANFAANEQHAVAFLVLKQSR